MGLVNRVATTIIARMSKEDKQQFIEDMTEKFLEGMEVEEKQKFVVTVVDKFFTGMTTEDKQKIMAKVMPQIMEGFNTTVIMPQMLMAMMGLGQQKDGMAGIMPMMTTVTSSTKKSNKPEIKASENFKPWESCPCRKLCEDDFLKKGGKK